MAITKQALLQTTHLALSKKIYYPTIDSHKMPKKHKKQKKSSPILFYGIVLAGAVVLTIFLTTGHIKDKGETLGDSIIPSFAKLGDCHVNNTCAITPATNPYTLIGNLFDRPTPTPTPASYIKPSTSNCRNPAYARSMRITDSNFGDPQCDFTKSKLYTLIKQKDAKYAAIWFLTIVAHESGYNPNAYNGYTPDPRGAWGLYQMGSSRPPEQASPSPGKNGKYDRGDVNWQIQTANAVNYNAKVIHCSFGYWSTASGYWGVYYC